MKHKSVRLLLTFLVVAVAVILVLAKYRNYLSNPWTRNGMVRAQVIQMTARVTGPIIELPIVDNQFVEKGDPLFVIDPRTFKAALDEAEANLDRTRDTLKSLEKQVESSKAVVTEYESRIKQAQSSIKAYAANMEDAQATFDRVKGSVATGAVSQKDLDDARSAMNIAVSQHEKALEMLIEAKASLVRSEADLATAVADLGAPGEENAQLRSAKAAVEQAKLDLEFTTVNAPVSGYVTNLELRLGSQAVANQPTLALVDSESFWVHGFFKENVIGGIEPGNAAVITLMSYPDVPLQGSVESIGWGIAQDDGSTGQNLLPNVSPTFEWIRLAQRVPVRIKLEPVPDPVKLRVGTTASVLVEKGTKAGSKSDEAVSPTPPVPSALQ